MIDYERDVGHWEKWGWQYYQRYKTLHSLSKHLNDLAEQEIDEDLEQALIHLMMTPPMVLRLYSGSHSTVGIDLFDKAARYLKVIVKQNQVSNILFRVEEALVGGQTTRDIPLDGDYSIPVHTPLAKIADARVLFSQIFSDRPKLLDEALKEGKEEAIDLILREIQRPDQMLMRWTYGILKDITRVVPTLDNGFAGYLPTILDGVEVRYYYPPQERIPQLSIRVNPLNLISTPQGG